MKKTILLSILALLGITQAAAQDYEYVPFVREGVKWVYRIQVELDDSVAEDGEAHYSRYIQLYYNLEFKGDTVINGKSYKAMHKYSGSAINEENDTIPIYMREEDKVVYGIVPDGRTYADCPINCCDNAEIYSLLKNGEEFILYDFNDPVSFNYSNSRYYQFYEDAGYRPYKFTDMITVNGHKVRRHVFGFGTFGDFCFVEGIGFDGIIRGFTLAYQYDTFMNETVTFHMSHVIEDGKIIYRSESEINKNPDDGYLPIARSDVMWVNEHVLINHGDTTRYYYTYKFKPVGNVTNDYYCYYSSEDVMNPCTDSLVSFVSDGTFGVYCIDNRMLKPYQENSECLIDFELNGGTKYEIYSFDKSDISSNCLLNYYIEYQNGDWLNRENFVQLEPLTIEGVTCSRYAYVNEQGDTAAYVVEGIGFDSRDMGDLLTPFTRKPDPNADYQEYCGLSHVIKDGKIIYKGMRFNPNAVVIPGDVDGDGEITISDANSVIDIVVMGGNAGHTHSPAADANGDGEVTIADVNAIVTMIMDN